VSRPYHRIPIVECGEPLLPIPDRFARVDPHPYLSLGADYAGRSPFMLRSGAISALIAAEDFLMSQYPQYRLQIFDAYRPLAVQKFMVDYTFQQLAGQRGWHWQNLTMAQQQELELLVNTFWANPSDDPQTPPPHSTGAAIDLTLITVDGLTVDMGSPIDEVSERSRPDYWQNSHPEAHWHRQILHSAMTHAGWARHPQEWWHFSFGDQMWAWVRGNQHGASYARYGQVAE